MYIAHKSKDERTQPLETHLRNTALLARDFANAFSAGEWGYCVGMLHDVGKSCEAADRRINGLGPKVDHSTAGAQAIKALGIFMLGYPIAGHHGGMPNGGDPHDSEDTGTLWGRMRKSVIYDAQWANSLKINVPKSVAIKPLFKQGFSVAFFLRMVYSCLVDADFLDTEAFMHPDATARGIYPPLSDCLPALNVCISKWDNPTGLLNVRRTEILRRCIRLAESPPGLFSMTVPTGGGKTISSFAFALYHALANNMRRIIYVIPYCSIIEQNAAVIRDIVGKEIVLEHHANVLFKDDALEADPVQLASENWDIPIIVTTNVQFFESLYSNKPSRCRKLHNIADSVLLFDEAQMIPTPYVLPCMRAIADLIANYRCSAVLMSATQPPLPQFFPPSIPCMELADKIPETYRMLKRARIVFRGTMTDDMLTEELRAEPQALCIVGTRKHARELYDRLDQSDRFHLSTLMYPEHRRRALDVIRARLKDRLPCRVVATSLIEAGVDVDFPVGYRAIAGLDSLVQAAGRVNREGRRSVDDSALYVFEPEARYTERLPESMKLPAEITRIILTKYSDVTDPDSIRAYFDELYQLKGSRLDRDGIVATLEEGARNGLRFPFADVAQTFRLIEQNTVPILIPIEEEARELLRRLRDGERSRSLLRKLGRFSVNVYPNHLKSLDETGYLEIIRGKSPDDTPFYALCDLSCYDEDTGLALHAEDGRGIYL